MTRDSLKGDRRVGDEQSWTIPITPAIENAIAMPASALECSIFEVDTPLPIEPPRERNQLQSLRIYCMPFTHPTLRHGYNYHGTFWPAFMADRLNFLGGLEFLKCAPSERPDAAFDVLTAGSAEQARTYSVPADQHRMGPFERPEGWRYYDHLMPGWGAQYAEEKRRREDEERRRQAVEREMGGLDDLYAW